jgi:hypothetical protein
MFGQTPAVSSPPGLRRHAFGLPAGSVRALLGLGVLGMSWLLIWRYGSGQKLPLMFIYLQYLSVLIVAHFFAAHGNTIGPHISTRSPLGLPRGSVRLLLAVGYIGLAVFMYLHSYLQFTEPAKGQEALLLLLLVTGFFLGHAITGGVWMLSGGTLPFWFQDVQAWVALLALLGLGILTMVHLFINPTLQTQDRVDLPNLEAFLAAAVGFYFGARS